MKKILCLSVFLVVLLMWAGCKKASPSAPDLTPQATQTNTITAATGTPTFTMTAEQTFTATQTITPSLEDTASVTQTFTETATATPMNTSTDTATITPSAEDTASATQTSTETATAISTDTSTATATITPIPTAVHSYISQFGSSGTAANQFQYVLGMCHDEADNIYIADRSAQAIKVYNAANVFQGVWPVAIGTAEGEFQLPNNICYDGSEFIYVTDVGRYKVMKFTKAGVFVSEFGSVGEWGGSPQDIVCTGGYLYICIETVIKKYTTAGVFVSDIGAGGMGTGELSQTVSVFVDASGNVYAGSVARGMIVKFDSSGNFVTEWAHSWPGDIIMDYAGNLLVPLSANNYIRIYTTQGTYITQFGDYDSGSTGLGLFQAPRALSMDSTGKIFVSDTSTDFVQEFSR